MSALDQLLLGTSLILLGLMCAFALLWAREADRHIYTQASRDRLRERLAEMARGDDSHLVSVTPIRAEPVLEEVAS